MTELSSVISADDDAYLYSSEWERSLCKIPISINIFASSWLLTPFVCSTAHSEKF